jgi:predicted lactoylglutathione lyase
MASKKEFNDMGYRQVQRSNSDNKAKMQSEEIQLLKNSGYKNVGWEKVTQLYLKLQDMLTLPYRENWSLDELFLEADRIGRKYQSVDEIATFEQQFTMLSQEIDCEIDRHFPDTEVEIIDFSRV